MKAVFSSDLKPLERLVAAVYADHARDRRQTFVTLDRLMTCSGLSRDAANRARDGLETKGWLVALERKPRKPVDFLLVIPEDVASTSGGPVGTGGGLVTSTSPDMTSTSPDMTSTGDVLHQSSYQSSHHSSSSPARKIAASLLGTEEEDEVMDYLDEFLQAKNVGKAKPWLEATHANGDLERIFYAYVKEQKSPSWGVESQPEDDGLMDNPGYVDGWGQPERVKIEDYYMGRILALGYDEEQARAYLAKAVEIYPTGTERKCWHEAYMTALNDTRCDECGSNPGSHSPICSQAPEQQDRAAS